MHTASGGGGADFCCVQADAVSFRRSARAAPCCLNCSSVSSGTSGPAGSGRWSGFGIAPPALGVPVLDMDKEVVFAVTTYSRSSMSKLRGETCSY